MKQRIIALLASLCLMAAAFAGCAGAAEPASSGDGAADGASSGTVKVGICVPLTGESAKAGTEFQQAAEMALEERNYQAGAWKVDVVWVDVTADPEKGSLALEQAIIRDGIDVALLNWNSSVAIALMDVAAKYQLPYYFGIGASGEVDDKWRSDPEYYSYYIAKSWPRTEYTTQAYAYCINQIVESGAWEPRNKKIAIFGDDTDFGRSIGSTLKDSFGEYGWEPVYEDYFAIGATDMYAALTKIKQSDASVVGGHFTNPASSAAFLKQARENNVNAIFILDALSENANFYELCGSASDYVLDNRPKFVNERGLAFVKAFEEKHGYTPSASLGGQIYDYTHFFFDCIEACAEQYGTVNSETLYQFGTEVLMKGGITYTEGTMCDMYEFGDENFLPGPNVGEGKYMFNVLQFIEGEMIAVWPDSMKEADIQIPDFAK